jgi:Fic family protein
VVLEDGITIGGKPLRDHYEATGHGEAFDHLYTLVKNAGFNEAIIKELHRLFYSRVDESKAGEYRTEKVIISGSRYSLPAPAQVPALMKKFVAGMKRNMKKLHPVERAALAHKEFVFIHPFVDGNGRVARLLMNLVLLQSGYCLAMIPPVLRSEYIQTLEKAHTDDREFVLLVARAVKETQKDYLRLLR